MARMRRQYVCSGCGASHAQWAGQCPDCGAWNTLEEHAPAEAGTATPSGSRRRRGPGPVPLNEVSTASEPRLPSGSSELDRVLGGGVVPGSVVLIGGDPGIGKSTLLLQVLARLAERHAALYATAEESLQQVALRGERLGVGEQERLTVLAETSVEGILEAASSATPQLLVVDSIQTVHAESLGSAPGSVAQVRESAGRLVELAKTTGTAVVLVGHVTKEGALAGPRVLEHMVDTVLYFESDQGSHYRLLRAVKNRFGAANEMGVFAMTEQGLREVRNPSAIFLSRHPEPVPGSAITVVREGSRPLLLEVQALAADAVGAQPRRVAVGVDGSRLALLLAVLQRHGGVATASDDVFVNVVGGVRIQETAGDLPALAAVVSSLRDRPLPEGVVLFGEVGLAGEVRPVPGGEERLREAQKHGFQRAVVPAKNVPRQGVLQGMEVQGVQRLGEALEALKA